jgi:type IV secretion system protein VirB9
MGNMKNLIQRIIILISIFFYNNAYALREDRPTPIDQRIKLMVYNPHDVFKYTGYYGYQANIEFASDESIDSVSMGDSTAWQIVPSGNRMFIKPIEKDATTNMTVITNKRTYYFELYAENAIDIRDPEMAFSIKFLYPDHAEENDSIKQIGSSATDPDLEHPEVLNFNYTMSGSDEIAPMQVYDDGEFTYLLFRDKNAEMPAIFAVGDGLEESMVNYRMSQVTKNLLIIEQVYPKLALRSGQKITCIFNEMFEYE